MKRIIRLTESDLTRIVKRVLKEGNETIIKVKAYWDKKYAEVGSRRSLNLDTTKHKVVGTKVEFEYKVPGDGETYTVSQHGRNFNCDAVVREGKGHVTCGDGDRVLVLKNVERVNCSTRSNDKFGDKAKDLIHGFDYFYLTPEGYKKLSSKCNAYASIGTKQDDLYMGGDYA